MLFLTVCFEPVERLMGLVEYYSTILHMIVTSETKDILQRILHGESPRTNDRVFYYSWLDRRLNFHIFSRSKLNNVACEA